jgi:peptide methionine sulfoxide reductase msrA/msrB
MSGVQRETIVADARIPGRRDRTMESRAMRIVMMVLLFVLASVAAGVLTLRAHAGPPEGESTLAKDPETMIKTAKPSAGPVYSRSGYDITPLSSKKVDELANKLTPEDARVILKKGTEPAFCGNLLDNKKDGVYVCKLCGLPLFDSGSKFESGTGWPSFFQPYDRDHIRYEKDTAYGMTRVEILCARSGSHLGHVFDDGPKPTGLRYCLNSASLEFVERKADGSIDWPAASKPIATEVAYFGGGCFWGVEERFQETPGVIDAVSGYMGGTKKNPTYKEVCTGQTGHAEIVKVVYDPARVSYETLLKAFFRYHDPSQLNRQGPDVGTQYRSAIFASTPEQLASAKKFIEAQSATKRFAGKKITTQVAPLSEVGEFYKAEDYHQDYSERTGHQCYIPMYDVDE